MPTARQQNSAEESAAPGQWNHDAGSDAALARPVPQLPHQCSHCLRWVDRSRLALMPIGASPWCTICHSLDQLRGAVRDSRLSQAEEDGINEVLFMVFELLRGR